MLFDGFDWRFFWVGGRPLGKRSDFYIGKRVSKFRYFHRNFMIFVHFFSNSKNRSTLYLTYIFTPRNFREVSSHWRRIFEIKRSRPENLARCWIFSKFENTKMITVFQKVKIYGLFGETRNVS